MIGIIILLILYSNVLNFPFDFHLALPEIQNQTDIRMSCDTIIHQLDLVCLDNSSDGFEFDNNLLLDNQIGNRSYARQSVENPAFWRTQLRRFRF